MESAIGVSAAAVSYDIEKGATYVVEDNLETGLDKLPEGEWNQVGSIHSHASMSAFHSGVDDKDEFYIGSLIDTYKNMRDKPIDFETEFVVFEHDW